VLNFSRCSSGRVVLLRKTYLYVRVVFYQIDFFWTFNCCVQKKSKKLNYNCSCACCSYLKISLTFFGKQ
jgi:hypothetical protein